MNIPAPHSPRRQRALRHKICSFALAVSLLAPVSFACAQARRTTPAQGSAWATEQQPDLAQFSVWTVKYVKGLRAGNTTLAPDAATLAEGVRLAERRRVVLAALMQTDPARALAVSLPAVLRAKLPASVQSQLETTFSAVGDYSVDGRSGRREVMVDGHTYEAHVSGEQSTLTSQRGASLRGIVLDGEAVLDADSLRPVAADAATNVTRSNAASTGPTTRLAPLPQTIYGNDPFSGALQLFDSSGSFNDDNINATKEPGEPNHGGNIGGASVWYVWTPTNSGQATFSTDDGNGGASVDTLMGVYTGFDVANLAVLDSNDDAIGFNSQVSFFAQAGTTYYIAVDGYRYTTGPSQGTYILTYFQQGDPFSPSITSDSVAEFEVNTPFTYAITATNNPTSFSATGLPTGLTLDLATGVISGTVSTIGSYVVLISASNGLGTGTGRLNLAVSDVPVHFPFFRTEVSLPQSPGVYYLHLPAGNIFGYYAYLTDENYIYHYDLGYEYTFDAGDGKSGIYFYDFASNSFFYTSPTFPFPYLYDFSLNTVLYYFPDAINDARFNTNGIRYFYNFATGQIISK